MKQYLITLAKEPSTWRGLVSILTAFGVALSPDQIATFVTMGLGISGFIGAVFQD